MWCKMTLWIRLDTKIFIYFFVVLKIVLATKLSGLIIGSCSGAFDYFTWTSSALSELEEVYFPVLSEHIHGLFIHIVLKASVQRLFLMLEIKNKQTRVAIIDLIESSRTAAKWSLFSPQQLN